MSEFRDSVAETRVHGILGQGPIHLETALREFVEEAMKALASDADELPVGPAQQLVAATCLDSVKKMFDRINP